MQAHAELRCAQALVERCAADGRAADVERCVLRLDLASLDFNQVPPASMRRICSAHCDLNLFEAEGDDVLQKCDITLPALCLMSWCVCSPGQRMLGAGPHKASWLKK